MSTVLLLTSVTSMVLQNCLYRTVSKQVLHTRDETYGFHLISYLVCIAIFGVLSIFSGYSLYTLLLGLVFGIVTAVSKYYNMQALAKGPMHLTVLITTSSMILPTLSGIFFGERFSPAKIIAAFVLIGFIFLSLEHTKERKVNLPWLAACGITFVLQGSIGILQKVHQNSPHRNEVASFLFLAFLGSLLFSRTQMKVGVRKLHFSRRTVGISLVCGLCVFIMNDFNLILSGRLPSQLFFPLVNGSSMVLTTLMARFLFREPLSPRQTVGVIGGISTLIAICLLP